MYSDAGLWFSLILVLLFAGLLFLRLRFPHASRGRETAVVLITTFVFFGLCFAFRPSARIGSHVHGANQAGQATSGYPFAK